MARVNKKFQRGQHPEIYLLTLKEQDKTKMELPLDMVSKHAFWYPYLPDYKLKRKYQYEMDLREAVRKNQTEFNIRSTH